MRVTFVGQQYFEILGNRGMYKDGWWLSWMMPRTPWKVDPETIRGFAPGVWDPASDPAELYYLPDDFSQANNLADQHPEKVKELQELFWQEAEKYGVLPLLGGLTTFFGMTPPLPTAYGRLTFPLAGQSGHGGTAFVRRQPVRIADGRVEGGCTDVFELICPGCGDNPYVDYSEITPLLQWLRGPRPLEAALEAYDKHLRPRPSSNGGSAGSLGPGYAEARQVGATR